eukprot:TRINITY_DN21592_c0_g1_i1.p1 TRINITY_DN21592_c0_g1~~TRINITY_DN21592_c0_g1_i1.p1  ORF type:complete len:1306 (+),score=282.30 TRINITY_DN21592_c0_g1_i1:578-3919(+)
MAKRNDPEISALPLDVQHGSVEVEFQPDLNRFGLKKINGDHMRMMKARAYDTAACTRPDITVKFNGEPIKVQSFHKYSEHVLGPELEVVEIKDRKGAVRAEVAIAFAKNKGPQALGFVNGIRCSSGTHIRHVEEQLADGIITLAADSGTKNLNRAMVKQYLRMVVKVLVDNPDFDSQTKTQLTTGGQNLGFDLILPKKFIKKVADSGVLEAAIRACQLAQDRAMQRGLKSATPPSVAKLQDATNAGKAGHDCTLILTEGDSAKALAIAGLSKIGRKNYGVFPLKGKLLNVQTASASQLKNNEEIKSLMSILGLEWGQEFRRPEDTRKLRYQHLMIFADQDLDGHHITGLVINLIHHLWPSLLNVLPDYIQRFATPIIKVFPRRSSSKSGTGALEWFFTQGDFDRWKEEQGDKWARKYRSKYYKGLGTSTREEALEYFSDMDRHILTLSYKQAKDKKAVNLAFQSDKIKERKAWLMKYDPTQELDYRRSSATVGEFFGSQFVHYSIHDCKRSIPSLLDGLKPSQRKVVHILQGMKGEKKVSECTGKVSADTNYHHGEDSLVKVIVNMAQRFVGTNNLNLLQPNGMFGTRLKGPSEHSAARYLYTEPSPLVPFVFSKEDAAVQEPQVEDGKQIEPKHLLPIFPLVLVNGFKGIGTGWATESPNYNPLEVVEALQAHIRGKKIPTLMPSYRGFKGTINKGEDKSSFYSDGVWRLYDSTGENGRPNTVEITELPVGAWTDDFIEKLENKAKKANKMMAIHRCSDDDDENVHILVGFEPSQLEAMAGGVTDPEALHAGIGTYMGLRKPLRQNMWLHAPTKGDPTVDKLQQFKSAREIIKEWHSIRRPFYAKRKDAMLKTIRHEIRISENKLRFVKMCSGPSLKLSDLSAQVLESAGFDKLELGDEDYEGHDDDEKGYEYLLSMRVKSFCQAKMDELSKKLQRDEEDLAQLEAKSIDDLWLDDLDLFKEAYHKQQKQDPPPKEAFVDKKEHAQAQGRFDIERNKIRRNAVNAAKPMAKAKYLADPEWLDKKTGAEVKELCKELGLPLSGTKGKLIGRLLIKATGNYSSKDWSELKKSSLQAHAQARGLPGTGSVPELAQRLANANAPSEVKSGKKQKGR